MTLHLTTPVLVAIDVGVVAWTFLCVWVGWNIGRSS